MKVILTDMKFILTILFFVITTFIESNAQVVTLPEKTARFYYERHHKAKTLDQLVIIKNNRIFNLERQLLLRDSVIETYKVDHQNYNSIIATKDLQTKAIEQDIKTLKKEAKKQKFQKKVVMIIGVTLLTLSLIYD